MAGKIQMIKEIRIEKKNDKEIRSNFYTDQDLNVASNAIALI